MGKLIHFRGLRVVIPLTLGLAALAACSPSAPPAPVGERASSPAAPAQPKVLTMAWRFQPLLSEYGRPVPPRGTNAVETWLTWHASLTSFDINGNVVPVLAQKVPSIQNGDWKTAADGTMEVLWKIRPGAVWHDGTPLSAEDFAFGYEVVKDPQLGVASVGQIPNISNVQARDPQTLAVSWKITSVWGGTNGVWAVPALPRHLLQAAYQSGDLPALTNSPVWGPQWVGLGPYRLTRYEEGSLLEGTAFDHYALGRPRIDRIIFKSIGDATVVVANLLAGAVDVVTMGYSIKPEQLVQLRDNWVAQGKGDAYAVPNNGRDVFLQYRDPQAPWARDLRFRQAMEDSFNRVDWVEALQFGETEIQNYHTLPDDPVTRLTEQAGVIKYAYDPTKATQLFAEAGWVKGADGLLRNASGQTVHFLCCATAVGQDPNDVRENLAVTDALQRAGLDVETPLPTAPAGLTKIDANKFDVTTFNGFIGPFHIDEQSGFANLLSTQAPRETSNWVGANRGAWSNSTYDGLYQEMLRAFDVGPREQIEVQMNRIAAEDLAALPMYYTPNAVMVRKGVNGINRKPHMPPLMGQTTWNIHTWDIDPGTVLAANNS